MSQDRYQQWWHNSVSTGVLKHYKTQRQSYINRKEVERVAGLTWTAHISHQVRPAKAPPPEDVNAHSNPWSPADKTLSGGEDRTACHRIPSVIFTLAPPPSWAPPVCPHRLRGDTHQSKPDVTEKVSLNQNQWYALVRLVLFCSTHTSTVVFLKLFGFPASWLKKCDVVH